ncbi:hypothetical protein AGR7B_Lc160015 [Agrobacterium deltaense RV3]|nr:hypothetical protein AGR7B_Lc160015 [Agrobacterium deltaense RV3]
MRSANVFRFGRAPTIPRDCLPGRVSGETSNLRIPFGPSFNLYTFVRELRDEGIEIIHCCSALSK